MNPAPRTHAPSRPEPATGLCVTIAGVVQGVGFRPFVARTAGTLGVTGRVFNDAGAVVIEAFGPPRTLAAFVEALRSPPRQARIRSLVTYPLGGAPPAGFAVAPSAATGPRRLSIPADVATCTACLAELRDPASRRHGYAFVSCVDCGPRLGILRATPYDRGNTTMASFARCPACEAEYRALADRRAHGQAFACPACGPRLLLLDAGGAPVERGDPLAAVARVVAAGGVVALKGSGGFHLCCNARDEPAVARLRGAKHRRVKPFAVMARDLEQAARYAHLAPAEAALLEGPERPIVLALRGGQNMAPSVAPGCADVGLMLPYAPLHHLLFERLAGPLVMTSANRSGEPTPITAAEAVRGGIADLYLDHDREIAMRADDSVVRVVAGAPVLIRRGRGHAPRPIPVSVRFAEPVLATGAFLQNAFAVGIEREVWVGPHVGDLDGIEAWQAWNDTLEAFLGLLGVRPGVIAHDANPEMPTSRYARERGARCVAVQHHHAHVAAAAAEARLEGPFLGLAFDGTGWGADGTAWGGELLRCVGARVERLASVAPLPLPGGDAAIRAPWRCAAAALDLVFDGHPPLERFAAFAEVEGLDVVRRMTRSGFNTPWASGVGRYFDVVACLALGASHAACEGHLAAALEAAAAPGDHGTYPIVVERRGPVPRLDLHGVLRAVAEELLGGVPAGVVAARFHDTIAVGAAALVARVGGAEPLSLGGGCFVNRRLTEGLIARLADTRRVVRNQRVPPGDGGIALGQAWVAARALEGA